MPFSIQKGPYRDGTSGPAAEGGGNSPLAPSCARRMRIADALRR